MARKYSPDQLQAQQREDGKAQTNQDTLPAESMEQSIRIRKDTMLELSPELNAWFSKRLMGRPTL